MVYPAALRLWRVTEDNEAILDTWAETFSHPGNNGACSRISRSELVTQLIPYAAMILPGLGSSNGKTKRGKGKRGYGEEEEEDAGEMQSGGMVVGDSGLEIPLPPVGFGCSTSLAASASAFAFAFGSAAGGTIARTGHIGRDGIRSGNQVILPAKDQSLVLSEDDIEDG